MTGLDCFIETDLEGVEPHQILDLAAYARKWELLKAYLTGLGERLENHHITEAILDQMEEL